MIPSGNLIETAVQIAPSKTYKIDFEKGKVVGMTDGLTALKQTIYLILNTERYQYLIHSFNYGVEFEKLAGKDREYVEAELKRSIEEALRQDDRIIGISDFKVFDGESRDSLVAKFNVITNIGIIQDVEVSV